MTRTAKFLSAFCFAVCISVKHARAPKQIIKGEDAKIGEFPYQVSIQQRGWHFCGGSIIDPLHILTASHCLYDMTGKQTKNMVVLTGTIDKKKRTSQNVFPVIKSIPHERYNYTGACSPDDIAILRLAKPIPLDSYQRAIELPTQGTPNSTIVMASGWGASAYANKTVNQRPQYLQKLEMELITSDKCVFPKNLTIIPEQICAVSKIGSTCVGDSGSPIALKDEIIGILSCGVCRPGGKHVFTRVHSYLSWINKTISS